MFRFTALKLAISMTIGIAPITRLSTAAVVQVVQPRFDAPATTNFSILPKPCLRAKSVVASFICSFN